MRFNPAFQLLAFATLLLPALALPQAGITVDPTPIVWVTVDGSGSVQTIKPAVITTEGHLATVSEAPSNLRTTAAYTLSHGGHASTYTGLAPVASATGTDGSLAGVFPACDSNADVGPVEPFCLPKPGSELHPGRTYYITWSPSYFSPPTLQVYLQALYSPFTSSSNTTTSSSSNNTSPGTDNIGFTSLPLPASKGFHPFNLPPDFLTSQGKPQNYTITFILAYADDNTPTDNDLNRRIGPVVYVTEDSSDSNPGSSSGSGSGSGGGVITPGTWNDSNTKGTTNAIAIALPVVMVAFLVLLGAGCFLIWRRTGTIPLITALRKRSARGYGVRQSRAERIGVSHAGIGNAAAPEPGAGRAAGRPWEDNKPETEVGIQLTERESWSPTRRSGAARNVFREEVERQARMG